MIVAHRRAERRLSAALQRRLASVAPRFLDEPRLIEKFIALEHVFFVKAFARLFEEQREALLARQARGRDFKRRLGDPGGKIGEDSLLDHLGSAAAPVFPGKEFVPAAVAAALLRKLLPDAGEREIADRDDVRVAVAQARMPAAIA